MPINQNGNTKNNVQSPFVPSLSPEHSIHDSSLPSDDSILLNGCQEGLNGTSDSVSSTNSSTHNKNDGNYDDLNGMSNFNKNMNDPNQTIETISNQHTTSHFEQTQFNCSQYMNEINCNTTYYEYDCNSSNNNMPVNHQQMPMQQASPYYVYHTHYSDYNAVAPVSQPASSLSINTSMATTPQQNTQQFAGNNGYYTGYSNVPYVYDPSLAYPNMMSPFSPVQNPAQSTAILSSPQQQQSTAMLASYQTPPQPQNQLYISPSSMASPNSLSPNDATPNSTSTNSTSTIANEHISNCNSPQTFNGLIQQGQLPPSALTPNSSTQNASMYTNQYLLYPPQNPYLTPQAYQSPMPSSSSPYIMYPQPAHMQGQTTPASVNSITQALQNQQFSSGGSSSSRYTNKRSNRYTNNNNNNKRSFNNYNRFNNLEQTPPQFSNYPSQNMFNSPVAQKCCEDIQTVNAEEPTASLVDQNAQATNFASTPSMCSPASTNYDYYDPNLFMGMNPMATYDYAQSGITTYGEENFDENYDDNSNLDNENEEQLACYVCRGRRMCFCYFLKVRYYKFPSFFDLVDHQYKKWRSSMIKAKKAQY